MVRDAALKTGLTRTRHLEEDVIDRMVEDEALGPKVVKAVDKARKPPIVRFVLARLRGVSISAMDKMRFASIWTPGHTTLSKAHKWFEEWVEHNWCPTGTTPCTGTTRSPEEQQAAVDEEAARGGAPDTQGEDEEVEAEADRAMAEEAEREPTQEEAKEATAESFAKQALELRSRALPRRDVDRRGWATPRARHRADAPGLGIRQEAAASAPRSRPSSTR